MAIRYRHLERVMAARRPLCDKIASVLMLAQNRRAMAENVLRQNEVLARLKKHAKNDKGIIIDAPV